MEHADNVDFAFLITDDEEKPVEIDLTSYHGEELVIDLTDEVEDVDIYEDLSLVLLASDEADPLDYEDYESLSDLSEDEFMEERAGSELGSAASPDEDSSPQELEFFEEDLLETDCSELTASIKPAYHRRLATSGAATPPSSPTTQADDVEMEPTMWQGLESPIGAAAEAPCEADAAAVQGCDPAEEFDKWVAELPFPPLAATLKRWRERSASPTTMEYIRNRRKDSKTGLSIYIPYNLRDILNAKKERELARGPRSNRRFIIEEYRLKKQRDAWNLLDKQNGFSK